MIADVLEITLMILATCGWEDNHTSARVIRARPGVGRTDRYLVEIVVCRRTVCAITDTLVR